MWAVWPVGKRGQVMISKGISDAVALAFICVELATFQSDILVKGIPWVHLKAQPCFHLPNIQLHSQPQIKNKATIWSASLFLPCY